MTSGAAGRGLVAGLAGLAGVAAGEKPEQLVNNALNWLPMLSGDKPGQLP